MRQHIAAALLVLLVGVALAADTAPKTLSDAEIYVKAKMREMEKGKRAAVAKARDESERKTALRYMAQIGELKKQVIQQRAKLTELQQKYDAVLNILKSGVASTATQQTPSRWGKPVLVETFDGKDFSDAWDQKALAQGPPWKIAEGMATGKETLWTARRFGGKGIRIEYQSWTLAEAPCDASLFLENPERDFRVLAGYGGSMNRECRLAVGSANVARKRGPALIRGKRQQMVVEVGEGKVVSYLDGRKLLDYAGKDAPKALENVRLGLYSFTPGMHFDNVKVYVIK